MKPFRKVALSLFEPEFPRALIGGILHYARSRGNWEFHLHKGLPLLPTAELRNWRGDGIIAACGSDQEAALLRKAGVPVVNVALRLTRSPFPTVSSDNIALGRIAAEHLIDNGFKRFAFFGSSTMIYDQEREHGFAEMLRSRGFEYFPCLTPFTPSKRDDPLHEPEHLIEQLKPLPRPIGLMAGNDVVGCGVLLACRALELDVPEVVSIVACDNDELLCEMVKPGLTSIDRQAKEIGYEAAKLLDHLMDGGEAPEDVVRVPAGRLFQRQSSDVLAIGDPDVASAMRFIRNRAAEPISVSDVLDYVPISRRLLELRFRQATGRTIYSEIQRAHIQLARRLLEETELSITEVSRRTGFNHESRFRVAFKKETGIGARQYRKRLKHVDRRSDAGVN
jgi:LacI family transcriptional regulator